MHDLAREAWRLHCEAGGQPYLVRPSIPILYFGDAEAYSRSARRVITVGLNPSLAEFPLESPFVRFRAARSLTAADVTLSTGPYFKALSSYFYDTERPYKSWFATFEAMLEGLGCSYYAGAENVALHTDLCSPLATNPTWSKLTRQSQGRLKEGGTDLWHSLVERLRPHFILISVARRYRQKIRFGRLGDWRTIYTVERENPYRLEHCVVQVGDSHAHMVFGQAAQKPFGTVGYEDKRKIGRFLLTLETASQV